MDTHFGCTLCGKCCRDTNILLTVAEAICWLDRGHRVQVLCEASPWHAAQEHEPKALHFKRRSFAVTSGSMPVRVVLMLAANIVGPCPNLLPDMRCGIYEQRPLVCRIYPSEINPHIAFDHQTKLCPPEAWHGDLPLLHREGHFVDKALRHDIHMSRTADAHDARIKRRLCIALNIADTALVHEAVLVYSPSAEDLLSALAVAGNPDGKNESEGEWRFVSSQDETVADITRRGGIAVQLRDAEGAAFRHFALKREALFGVGAGREA
jgi:Fe-S-cluster containining protein